METSLKLINWIRLHRGRGEYSNKSVRQLIFDHNSVIYVWLYDLKKETLLAYGCMGWQDASERTVLEFEIVPTDKIKKLNYEEALKLAQKKADSSVYVNIDKNIKMIAIPESEI